MRAPGSSAAPTIAEYGGMNGGIYGSLSCILFYQVLYGGLRLRQPPSDHCSLLEIMTRHYTQRELPFVFTNAAHACHLELDVETGLLKLLDY